MSTNMRMTWVVSVMLLVLGSQTAAFNPLALLKSHLGTLYELRTGETIDSMGRKTTEDRKDSVIHEEYPVLNITEGPLVTQDTIISQGPNTNQYSFSSVPTISHFSEAKIENGVLGSLFELGLEDIETKASSDHVPLRTHENSVYEGISSPPKTKPLDVGFLLPFNEILKDMKNMTFLPVVSVNETSFFDDTGNVSKSQFLSYLDGVREDAWAQFKSMAIGYTNWLDHEYEVQHITEKLPLGLIKKVLDLGDRVNFLHVVGKRVDPGLAEYLADQLHPLFGHFQNLTASKMLTGSLSATVGGIVRDAAWKTIHQFVSHVLKVSGNVISKKELESFKDKLQKSSPMAALGLDFILNGPPEEKSAVEGRSWMNRNGYDDRNGGNWHNNDGYGNYGSYDESYSSYMPHSGGYAAGVHLDPYLILAGLGASVLLAYLAYRVIVTTGGKRSFNDLTFMDLSDVPSVVSSLYSLLDDAEDKYKTKRSLSKRESPSYDTVDNDLSQELNSLWWEYQSASGCVRCALFTYAINHNHISEDHTLLQDLLVSGTAHLLGSERSGQLMDEVRSQVLEGRPVTCEKQGHTCALK